MSTLWQASQVPALVLPLSGGNPITYTGSLGAASVGVWLQSAARVCEPGSSLYQPDSGEALSQRRNPSALTAAAGVARSRTRSKQLTRAMPMTRRGQT